MEPDPKVLLSSVFNHSDSLSWNLVLESLTSIEQIDAPILKGLVEEVPNLFNNTSESLKERIAVKCLEDWISSETPRPPLPLSIPESVISNSGFECGIDVNKSSLEVLLVLLRKAKTTTPDDQIKDGAELLRHDIQQFILKKRATIPKHSVNLESICKGFSRLISFSKDKMSIPRIERIAPSAEKCANIMDGNVELQVNISVSVASEDRNKIFLNAAAISGEQAPAHTGKELELLNQIPTSSVAESGMDAVNDDKVLPEGRPVTEQRNKISQDGPKNSNEILLDGRPFTHIGIKYSQDGPPVTENGKEILLESPPAIENGKEILLGSPPAIENGNEDLQGPPFTEPGVGLQEGCTVTEYDNELMQDDSSEYGEHLSQQNSKTHNLPRQIHCADTNTKINTLQAHHAKSGKQTDNGSSFIIVQNNEMHPDEKHRRFYKLSNGDMMNGDRIANDLCLKCDQGGSLSVCKGENCSVTFHERCVNLLDCDEQGHSYCPFCLYKNAAWAHHAAKKRYMQATKFLACFIGKDVVDHIKNKRRSIKDGNVNDCGGSQKRRKQSEVESLETSGIKVNHDGFEVNFVQEQVNIVSINNMNYGKIKASSVESAIRVNATGIINESHGKGEDALAQVNIDGLTVSPDICELQNQNHQDQARHVEQENHNLPVQRVIAEGVPNEDGQKLLSTMSLNQHPEFNSKSQIGESSSSNDSTCQNKATYEKNSRQSRRYWTLHEEKALTDAMQKVSVEKSEPVPWAKIWETIKHAFHEPRQPRDLKDKWRNITNKVAREKRKYMRFGKTYDD